MAQVSKTWTKDEMRAMKQRILSDDEPTIDELKAMLDLKEVGPEEIAALISHIQRHMPEGSGAACCVCVAGERGYAAVGGLGGQPAATSLALATLQASQLERLMKTK